MPLLDLNGVKTHYDDTGGDRPAIVFAHGLLMDGRMFDAQVSALRDTFRCVTYDLRGQGRTAVPDAGYDMDTLTADAVALIRTLGLGPCHFVGLSMGGFVGLRLAVRHPELLRSLTLMESRGGSEPAAWTRRLLALGIRILGPRPFLPLLMRKMFGPAFLRDPARADERRTWRERIASASRVGLARAILGVAGRPGFEDQLPRAAVPTLVLVGADDRANPPAESEKLHAGIPGSRLVVVPRAGHSSTVEEPAAVTAALRAFLDTSGDARFA